MASNYDPGASSQSEATQQTEFAKHYRENPSDTWSDEFYNSRQAAYLAYDKAMAKAYEDEAATAEDRSSYMGRPSGGMELQAYNNVMISSSKKMGGASISGSMTQKQKDTYIYLLNKYGYNKADDYFKSISRDIDAQAAENLHAKVDSILKEHPGWGVPLTAAAGAASILNIPAAVEDIGRAFFDPRGINSNSGLHGTSNLTNAILESAPKYTNWTGDAKIGEQDLDSIAFSTLYSVVQSATNGYMAAGIVAPFANAANYAEKTSNMVSLLMGAEMFPQSIVEAKQYGFSDRQAVAIATVRAATEALTEKYSMEFIIDQAITNKSALAGIAKSMLSEGSEEIASDLINGFTDTLLNLPDSDLNRLKKLIEETDGSSWEIAKVLGSDVLFGKILGDWAASFISGAVSGGVSYGVARGAAPAYAKVSNAADTLFNGNKAMGNMTDEQRRNAQAGLIADAREAGNNSLSARLAESADAKGKQLTNRQLYALEKSNAEAISRSDEQRIVNGIAEQITSRDSSIENAEDIARAILNGDEEFLEKYSRNGAVSNVISEVQRGEQEWVKELAKTRTNLAMSNREITAETNADRQYNTTLTLLEKQAGMEYVDKYQEVGIAETGERQNISSVTFDENGKATIYTTSSSKETTARSLNEIDASKSLVALIEGASKYGSMAQAVYDAYVPGQNVKQFLKSADFVTQVGASINNITDEILNYMSGSQLGLGMNKDQVKQLLEVGMQTGNKSRGGANEKLFTKGVSTVTFRAGVESALNERIERLSKGTKLEQTAASQMKASVDMIRELSRITGINFELFESTGKNGKYQGKNGSYNPETNTIELDINAGMNSVEDWAKSAVMTTVSHEVTHWMKQASPAAFADLMTFVIDKLASNGSIRTLDYIIAKQMQRGEEANKNTDTVFTWDMALEEVVADGCQLMLKDSKTLRQFLKENYESGTTMMDHLRKMLNTIKNAFAGNRAVSNEAKILMKHCAEELQEQFDSTFLAAINSIPSTNILKEDAIKAAKTDSGDSLFSYRTMEEDKEAYREDLQPLIENGIMTEAEVDTLFDTVDFIMAEIEKNDLNKRLFDTNLPSKSESKRIRPYKSNADPHYGMALDFSTICRKRLLQQVIVDRLNVALKRNLSAEDQLVVNKRLRELQKEGRKIELACDLCYVEAARYNSPKWINKFLQSRTDVMNDYFARKAGKWFKQQKIEIARDMGFPIELTKTGKEKLPTKKSMGALAKEFYARTVEARKNYKLTDEQQKAVDIVEDLDSAYFTTADGLLELREEYPEIYDAFAEYIRNHARSKAVETRTEYKRGDIVPYVGVNGQSKNFVTAQNESGTRMQSWSDFEMVHILDHIAAVIELSTRNAKAHTYTKVPAMVRISGNTGIMFNLSLIPKGDTGLDANGNLIFDDTEGMPKADADELRERFHATAGNIVIGCCDEQIIALMKSNAVDYIIPYHVSGMPAVLKSALGMRRWSDYTDTQNGKGKQPGLHEWFDIEEAKKAKNGYEYMEKAADKYLQICNDLGSTPKFWQFLEKDENGNWRKKPGVSDVGYWKLLIDRKMVDQVTGKVIEQQGIRPVFNRGDIEVAMANERADESRKAFSETVEQVCREAMEGKLGFSDDTREMIGDLTRDDVDLVHGIMSYEDDVKFYKRFGIDRAALRTGNKEKLSDVMLSDRDSEGNELSSQQMEYFKDSKVRDEDGNLRIVYHGTEAEFTVFDRTKGRSNMDIQGSFFSPWDIDAGGYGENVKAYYLNIKNPAPEGLAYKALNRFKGQNGAGIKAREYLESLGYDGVNNGDEEYIAFYPEQIKLVENKKPTSNEDIRYSDRIVTETVNDIATLEGSNEPVVVINSSASGLTPNRPMYWSREIKNMIINTLAGKVIEAIDGDYIYVGRRGAGEVAYGKNTNDLISEAHNTGSYEKKDQKMIAAEHALSLIWSSKDVGEWSENIEDPEDTYKYDGMNRRSSIAVIDGKIYSVTVLTALNGDISSGDDYGEKFYDLLDIEIEESSTSGSASLAQAPSPHTIKTIEDSSDRLTVTQKERIINRRNRGLSYSTGDSSTGTAMAEAFKNAKKMNSTRTEESDALSKELELTDTIDSLEANKNTGVEEIEKLERDLKAEQKLADQMYTGRKLAEERRRITEKYENKLAALSKKLDERIMADQMHEGAAIAKAVRENTEQYKRELQKQSDKSLADQMYLGRKIQEEKRILTERYDQKINDLKVSKENAIAAIKESNARSWERYREKKSATELRHKIRDLQETFKKRLLHPTASVGGHIPAGLRTAAINVLEAVNMDRVEAAKRIAQLEMQMAKETNQEKIVALAKKIANIEKQGNNLHAALSELHTQYQAVAKQDNASGIYSGPVAEMIQNLAESFTGWQEMVDNSTDGTAIRSMTLQQLSDTYDVLKALDTTIKNANTLIDSVAKKSRFEVYKNLVRETGRVKKQSDNPIAKFWNKYILTQLRPETAFKTFGGFAKDSYWSKMAEDLNRGQLKMTQLQSEWSKLFFNLLNDRKNLKSMQDLVDVGLKDETGNAVKISRGMMLSLYMHLLNEQNRKHVEVGGLNIPSSEAYYKGDREVAYKKANTMVFGIAKDLAELNHQIQEQKEALRNLPEEHTVQDELAIQDKINELKGKIQELRDDQLAHFNEVFDKISKQLTAYEREWISQARYFEDVASPAALNEATEKLYGFSKARVENYWQIVTDPDYLKGEFQSIVRDASLENVGFMKERIEGSNPILLEDMADVIARQIRSNSQYAGMLIPISNFNKIYNGSSDGNTVSLKKILGQTFGNNATTYIEKLMGDLQGAGTASPTVLNIGNMIARARGGVAGSALTLSVSTALAQTASYPTAAAEIGWKPLVKALGVVNKMDGSKRVVFAKAEQEAIRKYSPLLWYRMQGYSTTEIGDMQGSRDIAAQINQRARGLTGWIQAIDGMTVGRLWYAAQYYVDDHNKALQKGSDAYYQEVAKVFNGIVEHTQPNYTTMQRPDILRSKDGFAKALTMFMTQRLQNFNIVYDAAGSVARAAHDLSVLKKNGGAEADIAALRSDLKNNRKVLGRAVASQTVAAFAITLVKTFAKFLMHNEKPYRDDDGELTAKSVSGEMLDMFLSSIAGNIWFGDALYNLISSKITGDKLYDQFSAAGIDELNNIIAAFADINLFESLKNNDIKTIGKKINALALALSTVLGIPLSNAEKIATGVYEHAVDIANGEFLSFEAGYERSNKQNAHRLFKAFVDGDTAKIAKVTAEFKDTKDADSKIRSYIKEQFDDGEIDAGTASGYLKTMMQHEDNQYSDDDIFWIMDEWTAEKAHEDDDDWRYTKYGEFTDAVLSGNNLESVIAKYTGHGIDEDKLKSAIGNLKDDYCKATGAARETMRTRVAGAYRALGKKEADIESGLLHWDMKADTGYDYSNIREDYVEKQAYDHATVVGYYMTYGGKSAEDAEKAAVKLDAAIETGIYTEDLRESFVDGTISRADTVDYLVTYQAYEKDAAEKKVTKWQMEADTGYAYDDIDDLLKAGTITSGTAKSYYVKYGGYSDDDAQGKVNAINYGAEAGFTGSGTTEANAYYKILKPAGVSAATWHAAYTTYTNTESDKKPNGKAVTNSKMKKFFAYVNTLNISKEQKKQIALAVGYSESKVRRYAWT